jgi:hypothetical protein
MKNHIRIIVQGLNESSKDFARRLEEVCQELYDEFKDSLSFYAPSISFMTTASDGRQTATIQFATRKSPVLED